MGYRHTVTLMTSRVPPCNPTVAQFVVNSAVAVKEQDYLARRAAGWRVLDPPTVERLGVAGKLFLLFAKSNFSAATGY